MNDLGANHSRHSFRLQIGFSPNKQGFLGTQPASEFLEFVFISDITESDFWINFPIENFGGSTSGPEQPPPFIHKIGVITFSHSCKEHVVMKLFLPLLYPG